MVSSSRPPIRAAQRGSTRSESRRRIAVMSTTSHAETETETTPATLPLHAIHQVPDQLGRFGSFGGRFVPETLMDALNRLAEEYEKVKADPEFQARLSYYLKDYVGRPSPLYLAER